MEKESKRRLRFALLVCVIFAGGIAAGYFGMRLVCGLPIYPTPLPQAAKQSPAPTQTPLQAANLPDIQAPPTKKPHEDTPVVAVARYLLKEYQGIVAAYEILTDHSLRLLEIYDVALHMLPEPDRAQLRDGIVLDTREEMLELLEDYK